MGALLRWPVGMALAFWRYLWRTSAVHRVEEEGTPEDLPPPVPEHMNDGDSQLFEDGIGSGFHRVYSVSIAGASKTPEELTALLRDDINRASPAEVAVFRRVTQGEGPLDVGDEYVVRMPGPWDGPVRVVDRTSTSFRLGTLRGHLEAGQIEFRAVTDREGLRFEIESWARSGGRMSYLLYERLRLAKEMQFHMWTHFCERVAKLAGGRLHRGIDVTTRVLDDRHLAPGAPGGG